MCYHYGIKADTGKLSKRFKAKNSPKKSVEKFHVNGFDHESMPILNSNMEWLEAEWGLVPSFATSIEQQLNIRTKTLNARFDSLLEKPSFKDSILHHRCLIPATHFFEWQTKGKGKYPFMLRIPDLDIFSFAGIFSTYTNANTGIVSNSFSIVTDEASGFLGEIHNSAHRKPIVLNPQFEEKWLEGVFDSEMLTNFQLPENVWEAVPMPKNSKDWGRDSQNNQMSLFD